MTRKKIAPNTARFVLFRSASNNQWYWKLTAGNGWTVCIGGEGFKSKQGARGSLRRAIACMGEAETMPVVISEPGKEPRDVRS